MLLDFLLQGVVLACLWTTMRCSYLPDVALLSYMTKLMGGRVVRPCTLLVLLGSWACGSGGHASGGSRGCLSLLPLLSAFDVITADACIRILLEHLLPQSGSALSHVLQLTTIIVEFGVVT